MTDVLYAVMLGGEHIGTIERRDADTTFTTFTFDRDYWGRPDRQVLGAWFENHPRRHPHANNRVPAWFSNLLPEGRLRERIAREQGVST
ncbi:MULTISPECIES: HipA N-terminal domain-containing protein [Actinomyces]|uniref:HipA N-terminal domain-containing protein n=1 Tax=Actinomyces TaxID=1654 RepID=UPI001F3E62D2|nr:MULTISPECIES: HipA N-terminal domain-containing protein [Actinomyces]